jgi:hypothetical protein
MGKYEAHEKSICSKIAYFFSLLSVDISPLLIFTFKKLSFGTLVAVFCNSVLSLLVFYFGMVVPAWRVLGGHVFICFQCNAVPEKRFLHSPIWRIFTS